MSEHPGLILKALYNRCPAVSRRLALSAAARNGTGHSGAQFNVNRVLGARIALGFVLMLTTGNIEDLLVIHQFPEGDIVQEAGQALAQVAPQRVSQAFIAALTAALAPQRVASTDSSTALMTSPTAILPASLPNR